MRVLDGPHSQRTHKFQPQIPGRDHSPHPQQESAGHTSHFIDRCSVEAFDGNGRFAMTNLVFPENPYTDLIVSAQGGRAKLNNVTIYSLK